MAVSYRKLWHLMLDKKVSKNGLEKIADISHYSMLKLGKDQDVSTEVLTKICGALNWEVQDIVDFFPDEGEENQNETIRHTRLSLLQKQISQTLSTGMEYCFIKEYTAVVRIKKPQEDGY